MNAENDCDYECLSPKVSVIVATYNRCHMVAEAILSVLKQTYNSWKLIVIDDGSTDATENIVREFAKKTGG